MGEPSPGTLLPARPPTPPRESQCREDKSSLVDRFFGNTKVSGANVTPDPSTELSAESPNTSSSFRKKVGFSDSAEYSDQPRISVDGKALPNPFQPLQPSAERKPRKSILKVYNGFYEQDYNNIGTNGKLLPLHHHTSFATMLESIVQQLAGRERSSKIDAYLMLSGSLKASDNVPDVKALKAKMGLLQQFITRDLSEKTEAGKPDAPLVINALLVLSSFLQRPAIGEALPNDFAVFLVDYSIKAFEDPQMSKDIVKHLMFVLAQQKFSQKIMNTDRVGRLITAVHNVESHVKGKSIVMGRVNIYRALLRQSKPHMIAFPVWMEDLFTDMISSIKEIRTLAITLGLEAAIALGAESKPSRSMSNLFQIERGEHGRFADFYAARMKQLLETKEDGNNVAQIWSVVMLFLRGKPKQLEHWPFFTTYLAILQKCFNASNISTRNEANYAWNRLVYAIQPDEKTSPQVIKMLFGSLPRQLQQRKSSSRRAVVLGSICNLFYYTLKPASSFPQLDLFWDSYVVPFVGHLTSVNIIESPEVARIDLLDACHILQSLFDITAPRSWDQFRAVADLQPNGVLAKELPALDSKWLRKSSLRIFPVLAPLLEKMFWDLGYESDIAALWRAYVTSIASPAVMEVKVSNDSMTSLAATFGFLHRIWRTGPKGIAALPHNGVPTTSKFLKSFEMIIKPMVGHLGLLPFTERLLCIGLQDTFLPVATPSHRPEKLKGEIRSPFHHIFYLLTSISPDLEYDGNFFEVAHSILKPFFDAHSSSKYSQILLAKDLTDLLPTESTPASKMMWRVLADFTTTAVDMRDNEKSNTSLDQLLGTHYRNAVKVLDRGISLSNQDLMLGWKPLFESLVTSATIDAGDAGRAIAVIEPLAKSLTALGSKSNKALLSDGLPYYHLLLTKAMYPKDRQALDAARKRLWGTVGAGPKVSSYDPYVYLYQYISGSLATSYESYTRNRLEEYAHVFTTTTGFLERCPKEILLGVLSKIEGGISPWILDGDRSFFGGNSLSKEISTLWQKTCAFVPKLMELHEPTEVLIEIEKLMCSGLESTHRSIANHTIRIWNSTFGVLNQAFDYPEHLPGSLIRLRPVADILLPFLPESLQSELVLDDRQPVEFMDTQEESSNFQPTTSMEGIMNNQRIPREVPHLASSIITRKLRETTPQVVIPLNSRLCKRTREDTPEAGKRKSRKRESTPRLRHDNSQIQFQVIESSPVIGVSVELQLLTDRQREVRERQQAEAAMFPDLKASPQPKDSSRDRAPEQELPLRQSAKSRTKSPPVQELERQATPNPFPPSEDDNFMISSPTPIRNTSAAFDPSAPPSSPPEAIQKDFKLDVPNIMPLDDFDVPSSPPEISVELNLGSTAALQLPSAQVDTYATIANAAMYMLDRNEVEQDDEEGNPGGRTPKQLSPTTDDNNPETVISEKNLSATNNDSLESQPDISKSLLTARPATPTPADIPAASVAPTSSFQFADEFSSPPSLGRNAAHEDIFEDAVSSELMIDTGRKIGTSLDFDDSIMNDSIMNDSSMLRIVQNFDHTLSPAVPSKKNDPSQRQTRASSKMSSLQKVLLATSPVRESMRVAVMKNAAALDITRLAESPALQEKVTEPPSPSPSLVPETPVTNIPTVSNKIVINGEVLDLDDTIVVDASSLENLERTTAARSYPKRNSFGVRKRKLGDVDINENEIPDSQENHLQGRRSPRKKQRVQPRNSSQVSQGVGSNLTSHQSQSIASTDFETSTGISEADHETPDMPITSTEDNANGVKYPLVNNNTSRPKVESMDLETTEPPRDASTSPDRQLLRESTLEGHRSHHSPDEFPTDQEVTPSKTLASVPSLLLANVQSKESPATTRSSRDIEDSEMIEHGHDSSAAVGEQTTSAPETPSSQVSSIFRSVKDKIQALVRDFQHAAFSREQVNDIEDMFMDAKEQLYRAGRRGRQGSGA